MNINYHKKHYYPWLSYKPVAILDPRNRHVGHKPLHSKVIYVTNQTADLLNVSNPHGKLRFCVARYRKLCLLISSQITPQRSIHNSLLRTPISLYQESKRITTNHRIRISRRKSQRHTVGAARRTPR